MKEIILRRIKGVDINKTFSANLLGGPRGFGNALAMETVSNDIVPTLRVASKNFIVIAVVIEKL